MRLSLQDIFGKGAGSLNIHKWPTITIAEINSFSKLPQESINQLFDKVKFRSVDQIPNCTKYKYPKSVSFTSPFDEFCDKKMISVSVVIEDLIKINEEHFLCLHPVRYDNAKRKLSLGRELMPIVQMEHGLPNVSEGRHRIIALLKFGFSVVGITIPENEMGLIQYHLEHGILNKTNNQMNQHTSVLRSQRK